MRFWKTLRGCSILAALALVGWTAHSGWETPLIRAVEARQEAAATPSKSAQPSAAENPVNVQEIVPFVQKGLVWLARAQHEDGGWGAGSHAAQQNRDPHQVKTDPATTAFVGLALLRAGSTPVSGRHREALRRATHYLVDAVERSPEKDPFITDLRGTQLQSKLGPFIDTSMAAQYLARAAMALPPEDALSVPVDQALDKCLRKLTSVQSQDGSWNQGGGWAPVLQSSQSLNALELAQVSGKKIDPAVLQRARQAQKGNYSLETGRASAGAAAGVELYAYSSAQKAAAAE
ncbi:MAG: prenyltransferase/squalene oxidase repeat-containing protein, partial [Acidobacteriota bacterium]